MDSSVARRFNLPQFASDADVGDSVGSLVPRQCTLDGFTEAAACAEGIDIREAEPLVPILVSTRNSRYRIIPLRWGDSHVLVEGGQFFPDPTEVRLDGSTFGGSFLKMHWIGVGMHLEFNAGQNGGPIVTTRIASIRIERDKTRDTRPH